MPSYKNRATKTVLISSVVFGESTVTFTTNDGVYSVPRNRLTSRIAVEDFEYTIEYHTLTHLLTGVIAPDGATLYRIDDTRATIESRNPDFLSRVVKDGINISLDSVIVTMMDQIDSVLLDRLKSLPEDYLKDYYAYETKVSYLASNPPRPLLFDPTPLEQSHALALSISHTTDYPPLIMKSN